MANTKNAVATLIDTGRLPDVRGIGGRLKTFTFPLVAASQAAADTIELGDLPAGFQFLYGVINSDVTFGGTATIALGISGTSGKYRAAAIFATPNVPTFFGLFLVAPLAAKDRVIATIAAASLPASGNMQISFVGTVGD